MTKNATFLLKIDTNPSKKNWKKLCLIFRNQKTKLLAKETYEWKSLRFKPPNRKPKICSTQRWIKGTSRMTHNDWNNGVELLNLDKSSECEKNLVGNTHPYSLLSTYCYRCMRLWSVSLIKYISKLFSFYSRVVHFGCLKSCSIWFCISCFLKGSYPANYIFPYLWYSGNWLCLDYFLCYFMLISSKDSFLTLSCYLSSRGSLCWSFRKCFENFYSSLC